MTAKDKALQLTLAFGYDTYLAQECVKQITSALEDYGQGTDELQNMDRLMAYWDEVYEEI